MNVKAETITELKAALAAYVSKNGALEAPVSNNMRCSDCSGSCWLTCSGSCKYSYTGTMN